ncbi:2 -3 -cyclic-nucleotide 3 -phosphodiesterase-like, partial [Brachionus plicatilis]
LDFAPLKNEQEMSKLEITQLSDLFRSKLAVTSEHPCLGDPDTIQFIKNSKVLFINRGLPGSGKSTLSNRIRKVYQNTVICAGDDYFMDEFGNYNFDRNKLHEAHLSAQNKAHKACQNGISPVVADNTNIKFWEFNPYLSIAREFNYIVIIIEPRTEHKFDIEKLYQLNKHNVPKETIKQKLKEFQVVVPIYFGWYLNEKDSLWLNKLAKDCLSEALDKCESFKIDLSNIRSDIDPEKLFEYKNKQQLHCTAKFMGKNWTNNNSLKEYVTNPWVSENLGKAFWLEIVGFSVSKRSIAADIFLKQEQVGKLWGNDFNSNEQLEVLEFFKEDNNNSVLDTIEFADRAHITIGIRAGEKSYKAGIDLVRIKLMKKLNELRGNKMRTVQTDNFEIIYLSDCLCYCKLNNSVKINSLFTGYY